MCFFVRTFALQYIDAINMFKTNNYFVSRLVIGIKSYCDDDYYGRTCNVHCEARDDDQGHYKCDPFMGIKICNRGKLPIHSLFV